MKLLGLDLGTTNIKAAVTDANGRILARGSAPVYLYHLGDSGVEQDLEEIWAATLSALRQATQSGCGAEVRALGVSSQGGALQLLDRNAHPVGRVVSWLDGRGRAADEALTAQLGSEWFAERVGHAGSGLAIGQLLRLRREAPGCLAAANRVAFVGDAIVFRLCGRAAQDATSAGLTLLYNPRLRLYDPELLERLGLELGQLPELISPRRVAGALRSDVADQAGLPRGLPVSVAIHDQYAAALGVGAVEPGDVMLGAGTAWVLLPVLERLVTPVTSDAFVCQHVVEGLYGQILSLRNGGSAVSWATRLIGQEGATGAELDRLISAVNPGSDGLCFWPFLAACGGPGLPAGVRGRLSGLQLAHTPAHVVRAVIEGLAFELKRHLAFLEAAHIPATRLIMCGGAAASHATPQIIAAVTSLPVACTPGGEGSVLGAAILARGLLEPERSLAELAAAMAPAPTVVEPNPLRGFYQTRFEEYVQSLAREGAGAQGS
jgi:sugar (pentulose or hexulose) kinase